MKFTVNKDIFSEAISFSVKLISQKVTLPLLSGVLIEAFENNTITISCFDYEVSLKNTIKAKVEKSGSILINAKLLNDIALRLPESEIIVSFEDNKILLKCNSVFFYLPSMPVAEYPKIPEVKDFSGLILGSGFSKAVSQVTIAASKDDITPVITGVMLNFQNNKIKFLATDRYRVAISEINVEKNIVINNVLIPAKILSEIGKIFSNSKNISISVKKENDQELIAFKDHNKTITSSLIKGNYPPVEKLFPDIINHKAIIENSTLIEAINRVGLILEKESAIKLIFNEEYLILEAAGFELSEASESIECQLYGDSISVSLKPQFLLDALRSINSEKIEIYFTRDNISSRPGPVLIKAKDEKDNNNYKYLLQPNLLLG